MIETVREAAPDLLPRLWLCHPDWQAVARLRPLHPDVKLVDSTRLAQMKEGPERRAAQLAEHGVDAVNLRHADWTGGLTTLFHRFDRYTLAWDLQHEQLLRGVLRMGIDGVFSDHVDRMIDAFRAEKLIVDEGDPVHWTVIDDEPSQARSRSTAAGTWARSTRT